MKTVICYVDFTHRGPDTLARTARFAKLCRLFMLLGVWDKTEWRDLEGRVGIYKFAIDWDHQQELLRARKTVGG